MKWLLAMLLAAAPLAAQDQADAPGSWTHFKPGTSRKVRMTIYGGTSETLLTLKEVTEKEVVFDMVTSTKADKEGKASVFRMPLYKLGEKIAEETLKFKGTDYKCRVVKGNYEVAGMKTEFKYWIAEGVDYPLKTVSASTGAQAWMNLETESMLVSLDEEVTIAGRKLKCAKYDGKIKGSQSGTVSIWHCPEIPGGMARTETEIGIAGGAKTKMTMETIEFEVKK
ncbi:MAG TPA: hypothetical protein VK661_04465 [Planctomycetota bacterium]|jgi:hypothetical protein|nr:hypothetical protein [Planctomycetota bacterium]